MAPSGNPTKEAVDSPGDSIVIILFPHERNMDDIDMEDIDEELYEFDEDSLDEDDFDEVTAEVQRPSTLAALALQGGKVGSI
jgi:hypothetical protein